MKAEILSRSQVRIAKIQTKTRHKGDSVKNSNRVMSEEHTLFDTENVKCSKLAEFSKLLEDQLEKTNEACANDSKVGNEEPKLSKEESQETRHLKELLLLHLDLIQQQQELIHMKDRQLQQVTQEKETLRCRLERMERRMSLLRSAPQATDTDDTAVIQPASPRQHPASADTKLQLRGLKRKSSLEPQSLAKKFATIARNEYNRSRQHSETAPKSRSSRDTPQGGKNQRDSISRTPRDAQISVTVNRDCHSDLEDTSSQGSKHSHVSHKSNRSKDSHKNKTKITFRTPSKSRQKAVKSRRIPKDEKIMRTDCLYYVPQEEIVPMEISPKKAEVKDEVLVPSFRIKQVPRGYTMEGTENLGDEIYAKRHQKPELEEKRRKRWDLQRVREQRALERLQSGRTYRGAANASSHADDAEFESFLPDPDKVEFIEICDDVPVSAFGFPLPNMKQVDFSLPWYNMDQKHREEKCRLRSRKR